MENVLNMKQSQKQQLLQQMMKEVCIAFALCRGHVETLVIGLLALWLK